MSEVEWREEDGVYKAEVNGWGVTVKPREPTEDFPSRWGVNALARCGCGCPNCGREASKGFALRDTVEAARSVGVELAEGRPPPEGFVPAYHGEKA